MKFAVDRSLDAMKYEDAPIGQSLKRVLKYWTMAGKFTGVHPELAEIGGEEGRVTDQGLEFIGDVKAKEEWSKVAFGIILPEKKYLTNTMIDFDCDFKDINLTTSTI